MQEPGRNARQSHFALAHRILSITLERGMKHGDHLPEQTFSAACGVSRTPIRSAFKILEQNGILEKRQDEGFFLTIDPAEQATEALELLDGAQDSLARRILSDRSARRIDDIQSVSALARRYSTSRSTVQIALKVLSNDGLVTQLPGRSWAFQPMIDSPKSIDESFDFRINLEPQALSAHGFSLDMKRANVLRRQMEDDLQADEFRISVARFHRADSDFHCMIAECSGNRFVRGALLAHHRLRQAFRKNETIPNFRLKQAIVEHLEILDSLERNQFELAAEQMVVHLRRSRIRRPEAAGRGVPPLMTGPRR